MASFNSYQPVPGPVPPASLGSAGPAGPAAQLRSYTGCEIDRLLDDAGLMTLYDRALPEYSKHSFDRIVVGAGGVTVIDLKNYLVAVRLARFGGITARRHSVLVIDGRDHTPTVIAIRRQLDGIRAILGAAGLRQIEVRGAMCGERIFGLPRFGQAQIATVLIDEPKPVVALANRPGRLSAAAVRYVWDELDARLGPA